MAQHILAYLSLAKVGNTASMHSFQSLETSFFFCNQCERCFPPGRISPTALCRVLIAVVREAWPRKLSLKNKVEEEEEKEEAYSIKSQGTNNSIAIEMFANVKNFWMCGSVHHYNENNHMEQSRPATSSIAAIQMCKVLLPIRTPQTLEDRWKMSVNKCDWTDGTDLETCFCCFYI